MNIKGSIFTCALIAAIAAGAGVTLAQDAATQPAAPAGGPGGMGGGMGRGGPGGGRMGGGRGGAAAPATLGAAMSDMGRLVGQLKTDTADPTKSDQSLRELAQFERDVAIAKMQTPPLNNVPADKKANAPTDFRTLLTSLQHTALDLEDAIVNKKPDDIKKDLDSFGDIEKQGHGEFRGENN